MFPIHVAICFALGATFGSFFNVCIYRIPLGLSVNRPRRSFCYSCGSPIRWYDNIPLISYWALKGRCRDCGAPFSARYFLIELLTALLFTAIFWTNRYSYITVVFIALTSLLIISTFTDLDHWIIPDSMSLGGAAAGIVLLALAPLCGPRAMRLAVVALAPAPAYAWWGPLANSAFGAAFGYGMLWAVGVMGKLLFRKEAMGMGDLKLFACIGAFLGWVNCLLVLGVASFIGSGIGLTTILLQKIAEWKSPEGEGHTEAGKFHHLPFGPSIAIATYILLFFQPYIISIAYDILGIRH
ncbi:MAG: prepilin peptidase [Candidatus Sumerlaeota bacterium]|nr:prepilin peptidase [Candidatus Sumerlaeota bacterium]